MDGLCIRLLTLQLLDTPPPSQNGYQQHGQDNCIVRMVGKTRDNKNVCVWASGFYPYFFLQLPPSWMDHQIGDLHQFILSRGGKLVADNLVSCTLQYSIATFGFSDGKLFPFAKLSFRGVKSLKACVRLFGRPVSLTEDENDPEEMFNVCECKSVPELLKAIHDTGIQPAGWIKVDHYQVVNGESRTDLNVHTSLQCVKPVASDEIPRFIEASFDGEMISPSFEFPQPTRPFDVVAQLAVHFAYRGEPEPFYSVMFCLDAMGPELANEDKVDVHVHDSERDLLLDFARTLVKLNPDIITGYNINKFDFPYLFRRAKFLGLPAEFYVIGRFYSEKTELKVSYKSRKNNVSEKKVQYDVPVIPGRRIEDCYMSVKNLPKKLTSYKLDYVGNFYLGVGKHDVEPEDIFNAYRDTTDRLAALQNVGSTQRMLTEVRVARAFDFVTRTIQDSLSFADIEAAVCCKWPVEFHESVKKALLSIFSLSSSAAFQQQESAVTGEESTRILNTYVSLRKRGNTLVFGGSMMELSEPWMTSGVSHEQIPRLGEEFVAPDAPANARKKRGREEKRTIEEEIRGKTREEDYFQLLLLAWEKRICAEIDVQTRVIDDCVTRKFAEKWWLLEKQVSEENSSVSQERKGELRTFLNDQVAKHKEWHVKEKTRIGRYCMQDASLPLRLRNKQQHLISLIEMSKVTSVPCNMLLEKGQTIKVINLVILWARRNNAVVTVSALPKVVFKGGCVLVPVKGFYKKRVFTLDFSSLYPSLIQEHKLCYLSLILPRDVQAQTYFYIDERGVMVSKRPDLKIAEIDIGPPSNQKYYWVVNKRTALPEILEDLVRQRSDVKAELEKETDPMRKIILDQRQLAVKLVGNSTYGFTGYEFSPWPCLPIACCTTVKGRDAIMLSKEKAETKYGAQVIYGDSVLGETPILFAKMVDKKLSALQYVAIENIPLETEVWMEFHGDKEWAVPEKGVHVWSDAGFTPLKRVIRHKTTKDIFTVLTEGGFVQVTSDHSLLSPDGEKVAPSAVKVGQELMHHHLPTEMTVNFGMEQLIRVMDGDAPVCLTDLAKLYFLADRLGWNPVVTVTDEGECQVQFESDYKRGEVILKVENAGAFGGGYVYDLETANHHFSAGIGRLIVHNTDSIMAIVDIPPTITGELEKMQYVFKIAQEAAAYISTFFDKPMKLLFEKVFYPYLLSSKKRYSGLKWTKPDKPDGVDTKGIEAIRRDNCPILRNTVVAMLEVLAKEMDTGKAIKIARRAFEKLANQSATIDDLTITKNLGDNYKSDSHVHVQVNKYLEQHHPLLALQPGDRVPYVVIKLPRETNDTKGYEKGYNPTLAKRENKEPDWYYYCFQCLRKPISRIMCIFMGLEFKKGNGVQPSDYLLSPYLDKICKNDYIQCERVNGNTSLNGFVEKRPRVEVMADDQLAEQVPAAPVATVAPAPLKNADIRSMFGKK